MYELIINFGEDQQQLVNELINELTLSGKIYKYKTVQGINIKYTILFNNVFGVYEFGYKQAKLFETWATKIK